MSGRRDGSSTVRLRGLGGGDYSLGRETPEQLASRFWSRVARTCDSACWLWAGGRHAKGYGQLSVRGRASKAHRVAWEIVNGPIPAGLHVLHRCDVPACVNPAHLWLGTNDDNVADKIAKGRQPRGSAYVHLTVRRGESNGLSKLTTAQVRSIRERVARGESCASVARDVGVSSTTIESIKDRKTWRHV